ncbi:tetraacyldisaccharide 4'-kinase [Chitinispirillales bacterium ANBcel5]|uniref:tetraacyldisaccharide 4'-kinase n=1 Tax=Cellulosispirillum alkaliphilum TaxID=3039283 RepID=UPI002A52F35A|nr:tetraacyldisaccharide 4'-kinase [Chitinispirillales bacterium ANBcel5]
MRENLENPFPLPLWLNKCFAAQSASVLYRAVVALRNKAYDKFAFLSHPPSRPTISIGGIRAGGTGKTPVAHFCGEYLSSRGYDIAFLSRGYGRRSKDQLLISPSETVSWESVGDEPSLLKKNLPQSWIAAGSNRVQSAKELSGRVSKDTVFILDDGFQHRRLRRNLDIICVHEHVLSDFMIPHGYLREPLSSLFRADFLILTAGISDSVERLTEVAKKLRNRYKKPVSILIQKPEYWVNGTSGETSAVLPLKEPIVVCGIARPHRFINLIRSMDIRPSEILSFKDHHIFQMNDFLGMRNLYSKGLVTTEKDFLRLSSIDSAKLPQTWYLKIKLDFADNESQTAFYSTMDKFNHKITQKEAL